jgi:ribosomal protein L11 methyltransferase
MELEALAVTVEDADADTDDETGAVRRTRHAGQAARGLVAFDTQGAVRRRGGARPRLHRRCCWRRTWTSDLHVQGLQAVGRAGLGAHHAVAVRTGADHADFWIVPSWHEPPALPGTHRDPARPRPGLRHRHASDHAHVPALDRAGGMASRRPSARARLRLRIRHPGHRCRPARRGAVDAVDIDPAAVEAARPTPGQWRALVARRPAGAGHGPYALVLANILATP